MWGGMQYATYRTTPSRDGCGTFYFTDCGHHLYSVNGPEAYHGYLCPGCLSKGVSRTLYIRGSDEANRMMDQRFLKGEERE